MSEKTKSKSVWGIVLKVIITVATTLAGVFGLSLIHISYNISIYAAMYTFQKEGGIVFY